MPEFVRVAELSQVPPGKMLAVRVEEEDLVLYNVDGKLCATRDFCPHAGYPLSKSMLCGKYVRCSLHSWEFDVTNGEYTSNPQQKLRRFPVEVRGAEIYVKLEPIVAAPPPPPPSRDDA